MKLREPVPKPAWTGRPAIVGATVLAAALAACDEAPVEVAEVLTAACVDARDHLADVPAPVDEDSDLVFLEAADEAAQTVALAAEDLVTLGDDRSIADLVRHLRRFPRISDADRLPGVAYEASAAIIRIDRLAAELVVPECGAAMWRPADWHAMTTRPVTQTDEGVFREDLNRLCAATFPNPSLLADRMPLLQALVAGPDGGDEPGDSDAVKARVLARLNTVSSRPADAARFIREFSSGLSDLRPSDDLVSEYVALLAAFMHVDAAVPSALSRDPPPDVRDRVYLALDELEQAWHPLGITC